MIDESTSDIQDQQPDEKTAYKFHWRYIPLGAQILFIAFGALVLIPMLLYLRLDSEPWFFNS